MLIKYKLQTNKYFWHIFQGQGKINQADVNMWLNKHYVVSLNNVNRMKRKEKESESEFCLWTKNVKGTKQFNPQFKCFYSNTLSHS